MKSGAIHHFPPTVFRKGKKVLWNRIERKPLANRPEERVRLRYIDYLTLECGWPATRIAAESAITVQNRDSRLRADLICYDKQLNPSILVECKAESITLNHKAADQIALYNHSIQADTICITNGVVDLWYGQNNGQLSGLKKLPLDHVTTPDKLRRQGDYWQKRGFAGSKPVTVSDGWETEMLCRFWSDELPWNSRYLEIRHEMPELSFENYYRLANVGESLRIAMSFSAGSDGNTYFTAICNEAGSNRALLITNLNRAAANDKQNSTIMAGSGSYEVDIRQEIPFDYQEIHTGVIEKLPDFLEPLFRRWL